ncbi:MAG: histidine triad nucleotide-binding protein [Candidatus Omnitrophota bacterium]
MENCLFCGIAAGEIPADIVYKDEEILAFRDIRPQAPVHVVLIPRRHVATLNDISGKDTAVLGRMFDVAREIAVGNNVAVEGYRIVVNCNKTAGQEVFHLHMHLLGGRKFSWPPG